MISLRESSRIQGKCPGDGFHSNGKEQFCRTIYDEKTFYCPVGLECFWKYAVPRSSKMVPDKSQSPIHVRQLFLYEISCPIEYPSSLNLSIWDSREP
jgi:hypothetical protein